MPVALLVVKLNVEVTLDDVLLGIKVAAGDARILNGLLSVPLIFQVLLPEFRLVDEVSVKPVQAVVLSQPIRRIPEVFIAPVATVGTVIVIGELEPEAPFAKAKLLNDQAVVPATLVPKFLFELGR